MLSLTLLAVFPKLSTCFAGSPCEFPAINLQVAANHSRFSYTFSVLFTGMQLQRTKLSDEQSTCLGHIEEAIPDRPQRGRSPDFQYHHSLPPRISSDAAPTQVYAVMVPQSTPTPRRPTSEDLPRYASMEEPFSMPRGRISQETTSSFNPDLYLVSDGFRPQPEPPNYSRPPSYRSGPPSIRNLEN